MTEKLARLFFKLMGGDRMLRLVHKLLSGGMAGGTVGKIWNRFVIFMDGKKRWTALLILIWPGLIEALKVFVATTLDLLVKGAVEVGMDPATFAGFDEWVTSRVIWLGSAAVIGFIGLIHAWAKKIDDLTPDRKLEMYRIDAKIVRENAKVIRGL